MDIGIFTDTFLPVVDGVGRVATAYAFTLSKMGHHVTVSCPRYQFEGRGDLPFDLLDYQAMKVPTLKQYHFNLTQADRSHVQEIEAAPMAIAHAHTPFMSGREALRLAELKHIPLVMTFHSKYYDDFQKIFHSHFVAQLLTEYVVGMYEEADEVWAVNQASADVLVNYGYSGTPIVMPNGASPGQADPQVLARLESEWGIEDLPLFLYVGQLNWKKNLLLVLEGAAKIKQQGRDFRLVLAGQGPDQEALAHKIQDLDLDDRVILAGHITDKKVLDTLYDRSLALLFPSLYDNAPMVVREAAMMATPSLLARGATAAEGLVERENVYLTDNDVNDMADQLIHILDQPEESARIGQRAKETIPISWESIMEQALARYHNLLAGPYRFRQ